MKITFQLLEMSIRYLCVKVEKNIHKHTHSQNVGLIFVFIFRLINVHNWRSQKTWACQTLILTEDVCSRAEHAAIKNSSFCPPWTASTIHEGLLLTPTPRSCSFYNQSVFALWLTQVLLSVTGKWTGIWRFGFWSITSQGPDWQFVWGTSWFDILAGTDVIRELSEDTEF